MVALIKCLKILLDGVKIRARWHFGFKLHLIINDRGELLAFKLTPGNADDRKPVPEMAQGIFGKSFGDRGYISQDLFEKLYEQQLKLLTRYKKNMKQKLVKIIDKILLRKRALIETVNDQLKNIFRSRTFETPQHLEFSSQFDGWFNCLFLFTKQTVSGFRTERIASSTSCCFLILSN